MHYNHNHLETNIASDSMLGQRGSNLATTIGTEKITSLPTARGDAFGHQPGHVRSKQWNDHSKTAGFVDSGETKRPTPDHIHRQPMLKSLKAQGM